MKLTNETTYRNEDIRRWLVAAHEATGTQMPEWKVCRVVWSRHNRHFGRGAYSNSYMMLTIPKGALSLVELALVTEHELAHNRGIRHGEMSKEVRYCQGGALPSWAEGLVLREEAKPAAPTLPERIAARAEHAKTMLATWEKKLTTAKRQLAKWKKKVRYYETRPEPVERAARPPKVVDPCEVELRLRGEPEGEFRCLIMDLSSETDEVDRNEMETWLRTVSTGAGYRFTIRRHGSALSQQARATASRSRPRTSLTSGHWRASSITGSTTTRSRPAASRA